MVWTIPVIITLAGQLFASGILIEPTERACEKTRATIRANPSTLVNPIRPGMVVVVGPCVPLTRDNLVPVGDPA